MRALFTALVWGLTLSSHAVGALHVTREKTSAARERLSLNPDWTFLRTESITDNIIYEHRKSWSNGSEFELKPWILPFANEFITDPDKHYPVPDTPQPNIPVPPYTEASFNDGEWEHVTLPHDWAIKGPFYTDPDPPIDSGMGRLPTQGVGWYRRKLPVGPSDRYSSISLEIDGAMSYSTVWINGKLVGGRPYGYSSYRTNLTPYLNFDGENQLAIRVENPPESSRWYSGGGIYRNVWLTKTGRTHVAHWGTTITTEAVSKKSAKLRLSVQVENEGQMAQSVQVSTDVYEFDQTSEKKGKKVASFAKSTISVGPRAKMTANSTVKIDDPRLWGPPPTQSPNLYVAVTRLIQNKREIDTYETEFGIRDIIYSANKGLVVNGEQIPIRGVDQHHDLGALGAAFNVRAAERQLEILRDFGTNAVRMSHNPPAPELLQLTDRMGFLVIDEIFDTWNRQKKNLDYHLLFKDWHEADLRTLLRRDRNHVSVIIWSVGNEVGEQTHDDESIPIITELVEIVREEEPTRQVTVAMNSARAKHALPGALDIIALNYQGEGLYNTPSYSYIGDAVPPQHPVFHSAFPDKLILSSESASAISSRNSYMFPVTADYSAPVNDTSGGNSSTLEVSAYELYSVNWGSSGDKVFKILDTYKYVAGEFVWTGFDYIGEPTPYDEGPDGGKGARSSYFGIVDLAGFKKDRFYLYQAHWRKEHAMAHILPHWNFPERVGEVTPVHVFTSGDEAELFLNNKTQGRKKKGELEYRLRWDNVTYEAGELRTVAYKNGTEWATDVVRTTGAAAALRLTADRRQITADGKDLSFVTVEVVDKKGNVVPDADVTVAFGVSGPGEILATDNGWEADYVAFHSKKRKVVGGLALAIVSGKSGSPGSVKVTATATGISGAKLDLKTV